MHCRTVLEQENKQHAGHTAPGAAGKAGEAGVWSITTACIRNISAQYELDSSTPHLHGSNCAAWNPVKVAIAKTAPKAEQATE